MGWAEQKIEHLGAMVSLEAERTRLAMAAGLAATQRGLRIDGALARPIIANSLNYTAGGRLVGWSLQATGGPARVLIHDGRSPDTDVVAVLNLADQGTATQWMGPAGVSFAEALYVECTGAGVLTGALWIGAVD